MKMSNKNGAFLKESKNFSFRLTPPSALCPSPSNLEKTFPDFAPLRPISDGPQVNHKVGGRRAECGGRRAEGGERQSQGKFFPGWRAEVGGQRAEGGGGQKGKFYFPFRNAHKNA